VLWGDAQEADAVGLLLGAVLVALRRTLFCFAFSLALTKRLSLCLSELLISIMDQFTLFVIAISNGVCLADGHTMYQQTSCFRLAL
jgi:hypothetical protein